MPSCELVTALVAAAVAGFSASDIADGARTAALSRRRYWCPATLSVFDQRLLTGRFAFTAVDTVGFVVFMRCRKRRRRLHVRVGSGQARRRGDDRQATPVDRDFTMRQSSSSSTCRCREENPLQP
jgi:hypothetical protein